LYGRSAFATSVATIARCRMMTPSARKQEIADEFIRLYRQDTVDLWKAADVLAEKHGMTRSEVLQVVREIKANL
jgi:hypothetical protein